MVKKIAEINEKDYAQTFETVKNLILCIMEESERARNDDEFLITEIKKINSHIKSETITRARRQIQNTENLFLPTLPGVLARRRFKQAIIKRFFGQQSEVYKKFLSYKFGYGVVQIVEMPYSMQEVHIKGRLE